MNRNYKFDLLRIILCLFVIATHSYQYCGCEIYFVNITLPVVFIAADGLFYIISGYFNLEKEFNTVADIKEYYKKKIIYILVPFLAFVFIWTVWDYAHLTEEFNFIELLAIYYESIMETSASGNLWFMYPLFGMLLATPFLSKMLHHMNENELKMLWRIMLAFNIVSYLLCEDFGINFRITSWFMDGWLIYYVGGYYYRHVIINESKIKWAILGVGCFVLTVLGMRGFLPFIESFAYATDFQPLFTIFCFSLFMLFDKTISINSDKVGKVIVFLSGYTYYIYMYHMRSIELIVHKLGIESKSFGIWMIIVVGTFVVSLIVSIITKLCLKPIQNFMDKAYPINN